MTKWQHHHFFIGKLKVHTWVAVFGAILALTLIIGVSAGI